MNSKGFTLIELLLAVAILSILVALSFPITSTWRESAQQKESAREILSTLRRARSMAVHDNQTKTVSIDLGARTYSLDGQESTFAKNVKIEAKTLAGDAWSQAGVFSITFRPQGASNKTIFIRVNGDSDLEIMVDSSATGLAHM
jgi:prepilin-type N-terminal cleavage/methylation domain-containing protein